MYICTTVYLSNSRCWPRWIHVYGLIQNKHRGPCHVLRFELIWIKKIFPVISPMTFTLILEKCPSAPQGPCTYTSGTSRPLLPLTPWGWSTSLPDPPPHPRSHWTGTWVRDRGELCYRRLRTLPTPWLRPSTRQPMVKSSFSVNLLSDDRKDFITARLVHFLV